MNTRLPIWVKLSFLSLAALVGLLVMLVLPWQLAQAATWQVNTTVDEQDGSCSDGDCSLRDAVALAAFGEVIDFAPALSGQTLALNSELILNDPITISGTVPITLSGQGTHRIFHLGPLAQVTLNHLGIISGTTQENGGGVYVTGGGQLTVNDCTFKGNSAPDFFLYGKGGAIYSQGLLTVQNSRFIANSAHSGGAIYSYNSPVDLSQVVLSDNIAVSQGGGLYAEDSAINLSDGVVSDNSADNAAGLLAIGSQLTVTHSSITGNIANTIAGGLHLVNDSHGYILNSTVSDNSGSNGAGLANESSTLVVKNSTIANNTASAVMGGSGGVFNSYGRLTLQNSTIADNSATGASAVLSVGGLDGSTAVTLTHSTLTDKLNTGHIVSIMGQFWLLNTLIANDDRNGVDCFLDNTFGQLMVNAGSLVADNSCNPAYSGDPKLTWLAANGGDTQTQLLRAGSPALDQASPGYCLPADQRGQPRPQGSGCDIGAVEMISSSYSETNPPTFPDNPVLSPANGITVTTSRPTFNWKTATDNVGIAYYTLAVTGSDTINVQAADSITTMAASHTPVNSMSNGVYTWMVTAHDLAGNLATTDPATFTIDAAAEGVYLPLILR